MIDNYVLYDRYIGASNIFLEVKVVTYEFKRTTIAVSERTKGGLDLVKHPGQTYDGVIQELIKYWQSKHSVEKPGQGRSEIGQ